MISPYFLLKLAIEDSKSKSYLSAPIHNYGNILAGIFFPTRALSVEWIRFLFSFI